MPVVYYNTHASDPCLTHDACPVCLEDVTAEKGKAHDSSTRRWWQRLVCIRPAIQHAIHGACLEEWVRTRLNNNQEIFCPTCKQGIMPSLNDRTIRILTDISKNKIPLLTATAISGLEFPYNLMLVVTVMLINPEKIGFDGILAVIGASGSESGILNTAPLVIFTAITLGGILGKNYISENRFRNTGTISKIKLIAVSIVAMAGLESIVCGTGALAGSAIGREKIQPYILRSIGGLAGIIAKEIIINKTR